MTVAQEQVTEFLSKLPAPAFPLSKGMLAHLAHLSDAPQETVAVLSGVLPEGMYKSPEQVQRGLSRPGAGGEDRRRTNGSRGKPARSRPGSAARRASYLLPAKPDPSWR